MHCFTHHEFPAVFAWGICFKGLCWKCMQPSEDKFVCSAGCAEQLQKITKLNKYAMSIYGLDKNGSYKVGLRTAILHASIGATFLGLGLYSAMNYVDWGITGFMSILGLIFILQGYKTYKRGLRL